MFDGKAFGQEIVSAVKDHMAREIAPILMRVEGIEKRLSDMPTPKDGKDADPVAIAEIVARTFEPKLTALRTDFEAIAPQIEAAVGTIGGEVAKQIDAAMAGLPKALGADEIAAMISEAAEVIPDNDDIKAMIEASVGERVTIAVSEIPAAKDGKDADPELIALQVNEVAEAILSGWERPQDGKSVTAEELEPMVAEHVRMAVSALPAAKDGMNGKDGRDGLDAREFLRNSEGHLIVTMSDGSTKDLGAIDGNDGTPGKDGRDGFSLENFDASLMDDGRTILLSFKQGSEAFTVELGFPVMIYRGVYSEGTTYQRGDTVTFGGSLWHCDRESSAKPDTIGEQKAWTLCAKRGRDGKDGTIKAPPKSGPVRVG